MIYYLYSESYRALIRHPKPLAIFSRFASVGEVLPFSILFSVDLLTPVITATASSFKPLAVRTSHKFTFNIILPSFLRDRIRIMLVLLLKGTYLWDYLVKKAVLFAVVKLMH